MRENARDSQTSRVEVWPGHLMLQPPNLSGQQTHLEGLLLAIGGLPSRVLHSVGLGVAQEGAAVTSFQVMLMLSV